MQKREVGGGGGDVPEIMLKNRVHSPQTQGIQTYVDNRRLLTAQAYQIANSMHALVQMHERTQQNSDREHRPLLDELAQVPHKTPLGTKES